MIRTDGLSNQCTVGVKVILQSLEGEWIKCAIHLQFLTTSNEAKYEAILMGLNLAKVVGGFISSCTQ